MMKWSCFISFLIAVSFFSMQAHSQAVCGFDDLHQQRLKTDPGYRQFISSFEKKLRVKSLAASKLNSFTDTIPVVVHIVHTGDTIGSAFNPTDAQVEAAINYANEVYAGTYPGITGAGDIGIRFVLAKRDPMCNPTNGIDRIDGSALPLYTEHGINYNATRGVTPIQLVNFIRWDPYRYYNIWIVNSITDANDGNLGGFAFLPYNEAQGATVVKAEYMRKGITVLPHELGHAFFLYHPFEGSSGSTCPLNDDCTSGGDQVCDTDPITEPHGENRSGINPCTNTLYSENTERNIMNYVCCPFLFTEGQKIRMQQTAMLNISMDTLNKSLGRFPVDAATACSFVLHLDGKLIQNDIFLSWQHTGTDGYSIDRSYDGTQFKEIGFIPGKQNSGDYNFHDEDIAQQTNYYRLRQVTGGHVNYSNTVLISNPAHTNNFLVLLNNPVHDYIDMQFGIIPGTPGNILTLLHSTVEINLYDMSGRKIHQSSQAVSIFQRLRIPAHTISPGVYVLQVFLNKRLFVKRIVKI